MDTFVFTVAEVANILGISRQAVYIYIANNKIPHMRIGSRILIPKKDFINWFKGRVKHECY